MRVALVDLPWSSARAPGLGLGLLKAGLKETGIDAKVIHLNVGFSHLVGGHLYEEIVQCNSFLMERNTSSYAFEENIQETISNEIGPLHWLFLCNIRKMINVYLDECLKKYDFQDYDVIGLHCQVGTTFTSWGFARRLKKMYPSLVFMAGGPDMNNKTPAHEWVSKLSFLDAVFSGPADQSFPAMITAMDEGESIHDAALKASQFGSITWKGEQGVRQVRNNFKVDMEQIPVPDYSDWSEFSEYRNAFYLQTSKGCWYGEKNCCTFCTEPELSRFTAMSDETAKMQLDALVENNPTAKHLLITDPLLPKGRLEKVIVPWAKAHANQISVFVELQPSTTRKQWKMLAESYTTYCQIGIESFAPAAVAALKKGHRMYHSINSLKWSQFYDVTTLRYNYLYHIPGETQSWFDESKFMIDNLRHFQPPWAASPILFTRDAPYFELVEEFGIKFSPRFPHLYPQTIDPEKVAYEFESDIVFDKLAGSHLVELIEEWQKQYRCYSDRDHHLQLCDAGVFDSRFGVETIHPTTDCEREALIAMNEPAKTRHIQDRFGKRTLCSLLAQRLVYSGDNYSISYLEGLPVGETKDEDSHSDSVLGSVLPISPAMSHIVLPVLQPLP